MSGLLLDTCAVIWLGTGRLSASVNALIDRCAETAEIFFSPISAWEIGVLGRPRKDGPRLRFDPDPAAWFDRFRSAPGLREIRLSSDIALAATLLPDLVHADPADRLLIATARARRVPMLTSDRRIIDYAAQGILDVIECRPEPDVTP